MKKLLNTFICILLTSPLAAFDIALDGVEFGVLQMYSTTSSWPKGTEFLSEVLVLNEGDVLQVLRWSKSDSNHIDYRRDGASYNNQNYEDLRIYTTHGQVTTTPYSGNFIIGPASIQVGFKTPIHNYTSDNYTYYIVNGVTSIYAQMDYAILRAGASTQSSYVTIPANPSGNFEVKLQTSTDLERWTPTTPGVFPYGNNAKFFRLVVE